MTTATVRALFEERQRAVSELRALHDAAEGREYTADEVTKRDRLDSAIDVLDERIQGGLKDAEREERSAEFLTGIERLTGTEDRDAAPSAAQSEERMWLDLVEGRTKAVEFGSVERRDNVNLVTGTATDGAEVIPTTTRGSLVEFLRENAAVVAANAQVIQTMSGEDMVFPTVTSYSAAAIVAEAGAIGKDAPQFGTVTLEAYKYGFQVVISHELEQDSVVDVVDFVRRQGLEALARGMGAHFADGTGSGQPNGVANNTNVLELAGTGAVTADELIDIYHDIASPYRSRAVWLVKDSTLKAIRKLKDTTNQYLWQPGLALGQPDTLLGRPIFTDDGIPAMAADAQSIVFGDMSGYAVRLAGPIRVERSEHANWDNDLVSYRFLARADGDILDANAISVGNNAAS